MEPKLVKIFQKAKYSSASGLPENIWQIIVARERRATRFKLWIFSLVGIGSLVGLIPTVKILLADLSQSGFYEYFSLLFSDGKSVLSFWKEFSLSLVESLPTLSIILTFSLLFVFFLTLRYLMKQIGKNQPMNFAPLSI